MTILVNGGSVGGPLPSTSSGNQVTLPPTATDTEIVNGDVTEVRLVSPAQIRLADITVNGDIEQALSIINGV